MILVERYIVVCVTIVNNKYASSSRLCNNIFFIVYLYVCMCVGTYVGKL